MGTSPRNSFFMRAKSACCVACLQRLTADGVSVGRGGTAEAEEAGRGGAAAEASRSKRRTQEASADARPKSSVAGNPRRGAEKEFDLGWIRGISEGKGQCAQRAEPLAGSPRRGGAAMSPRGTKEKERCLRQPRSGRCTATYLPLVATATDAATSHHPDRPPAGPGSPKSHTPERVPRRWGRSKEPPGT